MSSIGRIFKVTTFGESHGIGVGCIIENVPPLFKITEFDIQYQLNRRKPNQNSLLSPRSEPDLVQIYSGVQNGFTLGTPICLIVKNLDVKPGDYKKFIDVPRPGHADLTYMSKYGLNSSSGGGRASARETVARVAAGALAEKYLNLTFGVEIVSWVKSVGLHEIPKEIEHELIGDIKLNKEEIDLRSTFSLYFESVDEKRKCILLLDGMIIINRHLNRLFIISDSEIKEIYEEYSKPITSNDDKSKLNIISYKERIYEFKEDINIRCPHPETAIKIIKYIIEIKSQGDSTGGVVSCVIRNCPQSLGEPCFDKFEAELAKAMLSIPATKGFEIGSGFEGTKMKGSEHNDKYKSSSLNQNNKLSLMDLKIKPETNNSGGTLGGITTGENVYFKVAIKPVSTISKEQFTCDLNGNSQTLQGTGRHDPCVLPRAMPIVESMAAIVVMDFCLIQASRLKICSINNCNDGDELDSEFP